MARKVSAPRELIDFKGTKWTLEKVHQSFLNKEKLYAYSSLEKGYHSTQLFKLTDIEKKFSKKNRKPKSSIVSQGYYECSAAAMAMITKLAIETIREALLKRNWVVDEGVSYSLQKKVLRDLGFSCMLHDKKPNQECLVTLPSLNVPDKHHQVYWNGLELLDPQFNNAPYHWYGPEWNPEDLNAIEYLTVEPL